MAAESQQGAISAAFPAPPPFYKSFTTENLERLEQLRKQSSNEATAQAQPTAPHLLSVIELPSIPSEIHNLVPPAPPRDGKYRSFGEEHDVDPQLPTAPTIPTRENLLNLTDRLMQLFQRYVQIMATNPSGELWVPQWEEIKKTFEQAHGVINEYRPHEARENVIMRYEDQITQVNEESERVKGSIQNARRTLEDLGKGALADSTPIINGEGETRKKIIVGVKGKIDHLKAKEQLMWKIIQEEIGRA